PKKALVLDEETFYFYYIKDSQALKFFPEIGQKEKDWVEVTNWKDLDLPIITEGQFKIFEKEQKVKIFEEKTFEKKEM
ncbi:hypothetical protein AB751O23_AJ_00010, partial [Chlamydiales bacterium SCGC AB-751-O23]